MNDAEKQRRKDNWKILTSPMKSKKEKQKFNVKEFLIDSVCLGIGFSVADYVTELIKVKQGIIDFVIEVFIITAFLRVGELIYKKILLHTSEKDS